MKVKPNPYRVDRVFILFGAILTGLALGWMVFR